LVIESKKKIRRNIMKTNRELMFEIAEIEVEQGSCAMWWLGQMGYAIKFAGNKLIYVDAYLSDNPRRTVPPMLTVEEIGEPLLIMGTHNHSDHIDRPIWKEIAEINKDVTFVVPEIHKAGIVSELGIAADRIDGLNDFMSIDCDGLTITGVASAHEFLHKDEDSGLYPFLGFVIECGGITIYHPGDTCRYEGLFPKIKGFKPDVMILPINGRDAVRLESGCIGNLTYQEAADFAGYVKPKLTIPGHFEMFAHNAEDPLLFKEYMRVKYPDLDVKIPDHGAKFVVS
jgi:L-ascorbate 6-phosphate lactonase